MAAPPAAPWPPPAQVLVLVEVPRGSLVKWGSEGGVDYVSPVPCPFDYGSVPAHRGEDGDPLDALVLGSRAGRGQSLPCRVVGRVRFLDDGLRDDKWICLPADRATPPSADELRRVRRFFRLYAGVKAAWHRVRGAAGPTRVDGIDLLP